MSKIPPSSAPLRASFPFRSAPRPTFNFPFTNGQTKVFGPPAICRLNLARPLPPPRQRNDYQCGLLRKRRPELAHCKKQQFECPHGRVSLAIVGIALYFMPLFSLPRSVCLISHRDAVVSSELIFFSFSVPFRKSDSPERPRPAAPGTDVCNEEHVSQSRLQ